MKKIFWFLFLFVLCFHIYPASEDENCERYTFDCYDSSQNLPQNQIIAFSGTHDGYMFVAGRNFLARFDGNEFVLPGRGRLEGIPTSTINDFVIDDNGTGYIATDLGLWTVNLTASGRISFKSVDKIGNSPVTSLTYSKKKALIYGFVRGKGAFVLSAKGFFDWFSPENARLSTRNAEKIYAAENGTVWLGTRNGIYFMKENGEKFIQLDDVEDSVTAFAESSGGELFAGGKNGLYILNTETGETEKTYTGADIPFSGITALESENPDTLWIGTENSGGFILSSGEYFKKICGTKNTGHITSFARDKDGSLWFGTSADGFCIKKESAFGGEIYQDKIVRNIAAGKERGFWINTVSGIIFSSYYGGSEENIPDSGNFNRIFVDSSDNLWASDNSGLYIMQPDMKFKPVKEIYTSEEDLFPASSEVFFSDSDGNVWVNDISSPGALFLFRNDRTAEKLILPDTDAEIVDIIEHNGKIFAVTKRNGVFGLEENGTLQPVTLWKKDIFVKRAFTDSKQRIWIVTLSDEIFVDIENDAIAFPLHGISGKAAVNSINEDRNHNLWIATGIGVAVIKGEDADCFISGNCAQVPVVVYGKKNGMSSWESAEGRAADAAESPVNGSIWIPKTKGIAVFSTSLTGLMNAEGKSGSHPEIIVERIFSDDSGESYSPDYSGKIVIPHSVKELKISYSAPFFSGTGHILFDYSFDKEEVKGITERTVSLPNLQSGQHEFSVRTYSSGNPSEFSEKKLILKVTPAFYENRWFIITVPLFLIVFAIIVTFLNKRIKAIHNAEIKRLIEEKTAELQLKNNTLKEAVMKDPLTGLMNRRFLFEVEERKIKRFIESRDLKMHLRDNRGTIEKNDIVCGLIMMDIDHFKRVNDLYGHDAGDMVLKGVAEIMQDSVRADDILIRWGGEEFLIVLKSIPIRKILEVAKKIRKAIEKHPFEMHGGTTVWITVSMGVIFLPFFAQEPKLMTFENIITLADTALYHSKKCGRDMATFVIPGQNIPETAEDTAGMLSSSEFAEVNGFYTFEKIEPDNFSEFEI